MIPPPKTIAEGWTSAEPATPPPRLNALRTDPRHVGQRHLAGLGFLRVLFEATAGLLDAVSGRGKDDHLLVVSGARRSHIISPFSAPLAGVGVEAIRLSYGGAVWQMLGAGTGCVAC